jgi:CheY-specific phosphatase CheX
MHPLTARAIDFAEVQLYLVEAATRLFEEHGVPVQHVVGDDPARMPGSAVMAVVGYASPVVKGAVLMLAPRALVEALVPDELRRRPVGAEVALRDVLGEFTNMLAGRVKNQLVAHDVAPMLAPPTTVFGDDLQLPTPVSGLSAWHRFSTSNGDLFIRFDAAFDAAFSLAPADSNKAPVVREGEMVMWEEGR